ncbi:sugar ABC transporter permease [Anaerolineales bacterium HSG24]|nr:sugar ABC transporter permease [Anaerolineales bacterium HSG24]
MQTDVKDKQFAKSFDPMQFMMGLLLLSGVLVFLVGGFVFLRDATTSKWVITPVAIVWGVGGAGLIFWSMNWIVEQFNDKWVARLQPLVFVGPALLFLFWYLAVPSIRSFGMSLYGRDGITFVGLANYADVFTNRLMLEAFRNNLIWIFYGTFFSVVFGLLIAVLADRSKAERLSKALIFLPMAISFVGAGVIWKFIYEVRPAGDPQIGLLNALVSTLGADPRAWYVWPEIIPWNNLFLVVIMVWMQTGYAMVIFSAAIKGIPTEIIEAARVDGATEITIFFKIIIPSIQGTIIAVTTTIVIFALKIFDVVWVMTGGQFGTEVIATAFYRQSFVARNAGLGSATAVVLLVTVIPVMIYNLRQFGPKEETF